MVKFFIALCIIVFCSIGLTQDNSIDKYDLIGCWKYYPEENKFFPDFIVYRSCNYESIFSKPMKSRFEMNLKSNGECVYSKIGTYDFQTTSSGKWIFDATTNELKIIDSDENVFRKYKIERLDKDLLGLKNVKKHDN